MSSEKTTKSAPVQPIGMWFFGLAWLTFHGFLVWASWQGYSAATVAFVAMAACALLGTLTMLNDGKDHNRSTLPAVVAFPCDLVIAGLCVLSGGWMAAGGIMFALASVIELYVFRDLTT